MSNCSGCSSINSGLLNQFNQLNKITRPPITIPVQQPIITHPGIRTKSIFTNNGKYLKY